MKISIDLDCVLWHHQSFFRAFMQAMQREGHQVGILTSHKVIHEQADRALMQDRGFPEPDFYIGRPLQSGGVGYAALKAAAVRAEHIDLHFDDGDVAAMQTLLEGESWRVVAVTPRGKEDEHFD